MIHLPDITLVMLAGRWTEPSVAALDDTLSKFSFGRVIVFGAPDFPMSFSAGYEAVGWPTLRDAVQFACREVPKFVDTSHALFVQWDGYPIRPEFWSDSYRQFDYIGAVWPWFNDDHRVGNSGFSLRSKRFMDAVAAHPHSDKYDHDDIRFCRDDRAYYDALGMRYAPESVAERFSIEHGAIGTKAFGFHGIWNLIPVMSDERFLARLRLMHPDQWKDGGKNTQLLYHAILSGRRDLYHGIARIIREQQRAS